MTLMAYSSGADAGKAGDPPGNTNCGQCHTSYAVNSGPDSLIFLITNANGDTVNSIDPQTSYTLHVTVQSGGSFTMNRAGFQLIPLNTANLNGGSVGAFSASTGVQQKMTPGRIYITHTSSSNTASSGMKSWQISWTSPATLSGDIRFYVASVAADGDGTNAGDYVRTAQFTYTFNGPCYVINQNLMICQGDSVQVGSNWYSMAGTYYDTLTAQAGCDSVIITQLMVGTPDTTYDTATICAGDSIMFGGQWRSMAGTYSDTLTNMYGCDSIALFTLYVNPDPVVHDTAAICSGDSVMFRGRWISTVGVYFDTAYGANSCDTIFIFHVMPAPPVMHAMNASICDGETYVFGGKSLTQPGTYYDTVTSTQGCDTIHVLTLTVTKVRTALNIYHDTIFALATNAQYQWVMCDSTGYTPISGATMSYYAPTQSGSYAVIITQNGCTDTSACIPIVVAGIGNVSSNAHVRMFPNPTSHLLNIDVDPSVGPEAVEVHDLTGKRVMHRIVNGRSRITFSVAHLPAGMYYVTVKGRAATHTLPLIKR